MLQWVVSLLKRPIAIVSWCVAVILAGIWAALDLPIEYSPDIELQQVRIQAVWPGAAPRQVERYVTSPMEREVQLVPGVESIRSLSSEGLAHITIEVNEDTDLSVFATQVGERLTLLRGVLPTRVTPELTKAIPEVFRDVQGFMTLQVVGPYSSDELREYADEVLKPQFQSLAGIDLVDVFGGAQRELLISLDPFRLEAYGVASATVEQKLRESLRDHVFGRLTGQGYSSLLISRPELDVGRLGAITVKESRPGALPVRLDQVATLRLGPAPLQSISRIDGLPVVVLELERTRGTHLLAVAESVYEGLEALRASAPEGMRLIVAEDRTEDVRLLLRDLAWRGGLGVILVVFVLLFMLKRVRATLVVLLSVAVALAPALALFKVFGLTLNIITLAGLVLVFGLLVDNSVIVVEQLILQRRIWAPRGLSGMPLAAKTATGALQAVWLPLVGGTLSTMAVMLPLVYLSGELRDIFLPFGILVSMTLIISLISAIAVVPVLGRFLPPGEDTVAHKRLRRIVAVPYKVVARFPKLTLAVLTLTLGVPLWVLPPEIGAPRGGWTSVPRERLANLYNATLGSEAVVEARRVADPLLGGVLRPFFEGTSFRKPWTRLERSRITVSMEFPPGNLIERSDSLLQRFEQVALASESVYRTIARISDQRANMTVIFNEGALAESEPYLVQSRLVRQAVLLGGVYIYVSGLIPNTQYSSGRGVGTIRQRVMVQGPNYEDLETLAARFEAFLRSRSRRVIDVDINSSSVPWVGNSSRQVLQFRWEADAHARTGATAYWLTGRLRPYFQSRRRFATADLAGDVQVPIRVVIEHAENTDVDRVALRPLSLGDSVLTRLSGLADYRLVNVPGEIEREDQRYLRWVGIDFRGPFAMSRDFIDEAIKAFPVPPGYTMENRLGFSFFTEETKRAFSWVLLATVLLVFLVTAAIFESWRLPLVVMLSVPLAAVGVCLGFMATDASFVEGAFIGMVLIVGIAVNDSILLTDRFRQLRQLRPHGQPSVLARLAVRERLRPMWTTTLTSVVAMLPLLVFPDEGDFWRGLAVTVTGGLLASTLLAPLASVAMLSLLRPKLNVAESPESSLSLS